MGIRYRSAFVALLALSGAVASGCVNPFKTSVEWHQARAQAIPLEEAADTWREIRAGRMPSSDRVAAYNSAVRDSVVQIAKNYQSSPERLSSIRTTGGEVDLRVDPVNVREISGIDEVIPADFVRVRRGFDRETFVEGVGAPLIVRRVRCEDSEPFIPRTGLWYPVTGLLNLDDPHEPVLELIDPTSRWTMPGGGPRPPLSANYTAAFARDFQDRQALMPDFQAMLRFEKFADRMGIYRMTPFDPEKEVCVLVHGINSTPMTWHVLLNESFGDPEIRERYEFWTFGYPSGAPIPYLAAELRDAIAEMRAFREGLGAKRRELTIVGHSMGGLLAKAMTQQGGDATWSTVFNVPIEEIEVREKERETLRRLFYFDPVPDVKRVVFCATPHRGSQLAANPGAALLGNVVEVPRQVTEAMAEILQQSSYALTPGGLEMAKKRLSSIDQLRPGSPVVVELLNQPLNPEVTFHSIIGNRRRETAPPQRMSDGVVPYTSASIEGVASEKIVHDSPHGVHREPRGIEEIVRILKLP